MKTIETCIVCGSNKFTPQFKKASAAGDEFELVKCASCGLRFLASVPDEDEIKKYYSREYFTKRTERGYDNYFSEKIKTEIERVFRLNLLDLDFYNYEESLKGEKHSLDIGCAAGYFVNYLKRRGWNASGIDVSADCTDFARNAGLNVITGDYLKTGFNNKFDLITLWASIEHLHRPDKFLAKIHNELKPEGLLLISTCRTGGFNFMKLFGKRWRFYNFPEHIFYFSRSNIKYFLEKSGFKMTGYKTYGSNIGKGGSLVRKFADVLAKKIYLGDMMIVSAEKY